MMIAKEEKREFDFFIGLVQPCHVKTKVSPFSNWDKRPHQPKILSTCPN